jgi:hypothetical protein
MRLPSTPGTLRASLTRKSSSEQETWRAGWEGGREGGWEGGDVCDGMRRFQPCRNRLIQERKGGRRG